MKNLLSLILVFSILLMAGVVSGQNSDYEIQNVQEPLEVTYGGSEVSFTVDKTSSGDDGSLVAEVCGQSVAAPTEGGGGQGGVSTVQYPATISFSIPESLACGHGEKTIEIVASSVDTTSEEKVGEVEMFVNAKGDMNPHRGGYLYFNSDINNDKLRGFFLSNDIWDWSVPGPSDSFGNWLDNTYPDSNHCTAQGFSNTMSCNRPALMLEEIDVYSYNEVVSWIPKMGVIGTYSDEGTIETPDGGGKETLEPVIEGQVTDNKPVYWTELIGNGQCSNDPCEAGTTPLNNDNILDNNYGWWADRVDSATPLNDRGKMVPEGQVAFGEFPEYYDSDGNQAGQGKLFFICREGAIMDNGFGDDVDQVINVAEDGQDLKQCQPSTGTWKDVPECEDGLDNDEDGKIDEDDGGCENNLNSEDGSGGAPKCGYLGINSDGNVRYNYTNQEGDCKNEELEVDQDLADTSTFTCSGARSESNTAKYDEFCSTPKSNPHAGNILAVEFYPSQEYFKSVYSVSELEKGIDLDGGKVPPPSFPDNAQFFIGDSEDRQRNSPWVTGMMTLHQAENMYADDSLHSENTWVSKGMVNTDGYASDQYSQFSDAWEIANSGDGNSEVGEPTFPGGFYGKCRDGETWIKDNGEWKCTGPKAVSSINVTFYNIDPQDTNRYVGFELPGSEAAKWEQLLGVPAVPSSGASNLHIQARCWQGEPGHRPESDSEILSLSKEVTTTASGETNIVAGQVPKNTDVGLGDNDYSCNFGFMQEISDPKYEPSNEDLFTSTGGLKQETGECYTQLTNCFIVAGSNSIEPIEVTVNNVDPSGDIQTKLENAALPEATSVFNPFPTEGEGSFGQTEPRNPLEVCRDRHGCPPS